MKKFTRRQLETKTQMQLAQIVIDLGVVDMGEDAKEVAELLKETLIRTILAVQNY